MRFLIALLLLVSGCSGQPGSKAVLDSEESYSSAAESDSAEMFGRAMANSEFAKSGEAGFNPVEGQIKLTDASVNRKIIYTANVELVVEEFDGLEKRLQKTIKDFNGYLAKVNLDRMRGQRRSGKWTARIPVDQYEKFLEAILELGIPVSHDQNAQDVTEEFVDLTARIANQKKLEARILELLQRPDDKIQHVIEVEKELARVREQIERMEGRIRFLADKTAMTTVVITAREERNYQPPQAPSFDNRIASAWSGSISTTQTALGNFAVSLVGSIIPLVICIAGLVMFWFVLGRRIWKWMRTSTSVVEEAEVLMD